MSLQRGDRFEASSPPECCGTAGQVVSDTWNETVPDKVTGQRPSTREQQQQQRCLNHMNEGIRSVLEVKCPSPSLLLSLSLHSNRVSSLQGLASMTALTALNLSSNELDGAAIRSSSPHLGTLSSLEILDLSCNRVDTLLGLPFLPRLSRLLLPYNRLTSLDGIQALASSLVHLDVRDNRIAGPADAHSPHLAALGRLKTLLLMSPGGAQANPVCSCPGYRQQVFEAVRSLVALDGGNRPAPNRLAGGGAGVAREDGRRRDRDDNYAVHQKQLGQSGRDLTDSIQRVHSVPGVENRGLLSVQDLESSGDFTQTGTGGVRDDRGGFVGVEQRAESDAEAGPAPEEVVPAMPRFDAVAGRFFQRRPKEKARFAFRGSDAQRGNGEARTESDGDGYMSRGTCSSTTASSLSVGERVVRQGNRGRIRNSGVTPREEDLHQGGKMPAELGMESIYPEHTINSVKRGDAEGSKGGRRTGRGGGKGRGADGEDSDDDVFGGVTQEAQRGEDGFEEEGLLSRLRSMAQEARLEVMDSRLQELHEKQAQEAAGARKAVIAAEAAAAAPVEATEIKGTETDGRNASVVRQKMEQSRASKVPTAGRGGRYNPWVYGARSVVGHRHKSVSSTGRHMRREPQGTPAAVLAGGESERAARQHDQQQERHAVGRRPRATTTTTVANGMASNKSNTTRCHVCGVGVVGALVAVVNAGATSCGTFAGSRHFEVDRSACATHQVGATAAAAGSRSSADVGGFCPRCFCAARPFHWGEKQESGPEAGSHPNLTGVTDGFTSPGSLPAAASVPALTVKIRQPPHVSDASTQGNADRDPVCAPPARSHSVQVARARRLAGGASASAPVAAEVAVAAGAGMFAGCRSGAGVGRALSGVVPAASVAGAAMAAMVAFDKRQLAVYFLRWARDTDRAKAKAAADSAEEALSAARRDAERERQAWESLQAALQGAATAREQEAREMAEEKAREELRSLATACQAAEAGMETLRRQLETAKEEASAALLGERQQAQAARQQAQAELARVKKGAEEIAASIEQRADARVQRLEEQLREKTRSESEAEEDRRRIRAQLREMESRCRVLQDEVEEARAKERRISGDADDARRRAAADADAKLAIAVSEERSRTSALKVHLEEAETAARSAAAVANEARDREVRSTRAAAELLDLVRQQKAALLKVRGEVGAARAEMISSCDETKALKAESAKMASELQELRHALQSSDEELAVERRAGRQQTEASAAAEARTKALQQRTKEAESKLAASAGAQEDLRAALMVKDKVLDDREKLIEELRAREEDALSEARGWRDRLEALQSDADQQLDAAQDEISELQAQVVALSGVEEQLRDVFKELKRYRKRTTDGGNRDDGQEHNVGGASSSGIDSEKDGEETFAEDYSAGGGVLTAVAAVTSAAKAVEEELRKQLEAKNQALRYVENELLSMKSLFEEKEAGLREELSGERERLEKEIEVLRQRAQQATAGRTNAEEAAREHKAAADALRSSLQAGELRSKELEGTLRALLYKYEEEKRYTSQKVAAMAALFQQLQATATAPAATAVLRKPPPQETCFRSSNDDSGGHDRL